MSECSYTDIEYHDIGLLLCVIRDTDNPLLAHRCNECIEAFTTKKKLGQIVSLDDVRKEFQVDNASWKLWFEEE